MLAALERAPIARPFSLLVQAPGSVAWLGGTWLGDKTVATVLEPSQPAGLTVSRSRNKYAQAPGADCRCVCPFVFRLVSFFAI